MDFVIIAIASLTCLWLVMRHYEKRVTDLQSQLDAMRGDYDEPLRSSIRRHPANLRAVK